MMDELLMPTAEEVLDVTALTRLIRRQLEGRFAQIWVRGEVSNLRRQGSGHLYFSLKDAGSQLPCVLFAGDAVRQSVQPEDGMELLLLGNISVYEPHGRYQLIAKIAIRSGDGRLQLEYERLKRKLAAEGLFDAGRRRALPRPPSRIALITSPSGAAVRDFLRILKRRDYRGEVMVFPVRVQGKTAAGEVAAMLEHANASDGFDLIVLTRGGGSIEDLWAFNDEPLVRAVAASRLPVISAIGHEIDHVLTDYAADVRAETPSGAAELVSSLYLDSSSRLQQASAQLRTVVATMLRQQEHRLQQLTACLRVIAPSRRVELLAMQVDDLENQLLRSAEIRLAQSQKTLDALSRRILQRDPRLRLQLAWQQTTTQGIRLRRSAEHQLSAQREALQQLAKRLNNSSLPATLGRGYAILQAQDGRILPDKESALKEPHIRVRLRDGEIPLQLDHQSAQKK